MSARSLLPFRVALGLLMAAVSVTALAADKEIKPGDTVVVARDGAKLMQGKEVLAEFKKGTLFHVTAVKGSWVGGYSETNDDKKTGWVRKAQLQFVAPSDKPTKEDQPGGASEQGPGIPGLPLKNLTGKLEFPVGVLVSVEFPKRVVRQYGSSTQIKSVNGKVTGESKSRAETNAASGLERPIWLVFDAGRTAGTGVSVNDAEYTIKIAESVFECLGADITEGESAMAAYNIAYSHKGKRGYRRLLFVIPAEAHSITLQYKPTTEAAVSVSADLPPEQPAKSADTVGPAKAGLVNGKPQELLYEFDPFNKKEDKVRMPGDAVANLGGNGEVWVTGFDVAIPGIPVPDSGSFQVEFIGVELDPILKASVNGRQVWRFHDEEKPPSTSPAITLTEAEQQAKTFVLEVGVESPRDFFLGGIQGFRVQERR